MRYFIDEPDVGDMRFPLIGANDKIQWFDSKEEAIAEAERLTKQSEIAFGVWDENSNPV